MLKAAYWLFLSTSQQSYLCNASYSIYSSFCKDPENSCNAKEKKVLSSYKGGYSC